jgi:hypothetical protein
MVNCLNHWLKGYKAGMDTNKTGRGTRFCVPTCFICTRIALELSDGRLYVEDYFNTKLALPAINPLL